MKKIIILSLLLSSLIVLALQPVSVRAIQAGEGTAPAINAAQDAHHKRMISLMEDFKNAKTDDQRKQIHDQMRQERDQYRTANPPKELTPAEIDAQRLKMEETLKKDPFRWEMYQLRQSMAKAKTQEERESLQTKIQALMDRHAAEEEAKLTPEQRAAAQARKEKNEQMQAELKPLMGQLHAAATDAARKNIRAQMRDIFKKYR